MWLLTNRNQDVITFRPKSSVDNKICAICGQYINREEEYCIVVPPMKFRPLDKKLQLNFAVHKDCYREFIKGVKSDEDLAYKFVNHKKPRKKPFTEEELNRIKIFEEVCREYGFTEVINKPYGLRMKKRGTSITLDYYVYIDTVDLNKRYRPGLLDGFYERELVALVYTKMHNRIGDGKKDDFSADKVINEVIEKTDYIMNGVKQKKR